MKVIKKLMYFINNIKRDILNWIGRKSFSIDERHEYIHNKLRKSYEIGDADWIINEMIATKQLIDDEFVVTVNENFSLLTQYN